jgi:hypothetical protein
MNERWRNALNEKRCIDCFEGALRAGYTKIFFAPRGEGFLRGIEDRLEDYGDVILPCPLHNTESRMQVVTYIGNHPGHLLPVFVHVQIPMSLMDMKVSEFVEFSHSGNADAVPVGAEYDPWEQVLIAVSRALVAVIEKARDEGLEARA